MRTCHFCERQGYTPKVYDDQHPYYMCGACQNRYGISPCGPPLLGAVVGISLGFLMITLLLGAGIRIVLGG